ncbi:ABC transporter ATP-binding protein/permease, partial [Dehalococcoidia bacterium]|nr:ABC transporter ATP-binding protein/permease [Dehalococcoidia bacterium]
LADIRLLLVNHLKRLPLSFFQKRRAGELSKIVNYDVEQIELLLAHSLPDRFTVISVAIIVFATVLILDWRMGLAMVSLLPLLFIALAILSKSWKRREVNYSKSMADMTTSLMEFISCISVIKAFGREERRSGILDEKMENYKGWAIRQLNGASVPIGAMSILLEGGLAVLVILGSIFLLNDEIRMETFFVIFILAVGFYGVLSKIYFIVGTNAMYQSAQNNINSILAEEPPKLPPAAHGKLPAGDIAFKEVLFGYENDRAVLQNINLSIPQGSTTAFIGKSGSGKSTLANLIMRFWIPNEGEITIGGMSINQFKEEDLAAFISMVHQDVFLFNTTIAENIRLGKQGAADQEVIAAAKEARIHEFVESLPAGYQTNVGEKGARLSGGEKQRISIARAILKDAPVVILDEATASVDPYNEKLIHEAIGNLTRNKTLIVIAHHLDTVMTADQIVLLDEGRILACGRHEGLLEESGLYRQMWQDQEHINQWGLGTL